MRNTPAQPWPSRFTSWLPAAWAALVICLARLVWADTALAEERPVLVRTAPESETRELRQRTMDELRAGGFEPLTHDSDARAIAVLTITERRNDDGTLQWHLEVDDRLTHKTSQRVLEESTLSGNASHVPLHAVELLHASLLELEHGNGPPGPAPIPPAPPNPPPPTALADDRERTPRVSAWTGAGAARSRGGFAAVPVGSLGLAWQALEGWQAELDLLASLERQELATDFATVSTRWGLGRFHLGHVWRVSPSWGTYVGGGGGVAALRARGHAPAPLDGHVDWTAVGVASLRWVVTWRPAARLRFRFCVDGGWAPSPVIVQVADEELATWGQPTLSGLVALEWLANLYPPRRTP